MEVCHLLPNGALAVELADDILILVVGDTPAHARTLLGPVAREIELRLWADGASLSPGKSHWVFFTPHLYGIDGEIIPYATDK